MTSLFIVTSAIHTSYGKCSTEERIEQTKDTLKSIETYAPGSSAVIIDCGEKSIDKNLFDCEVIDYTTHQEIQHHLQNFLSTTKDTQPEIILKSMLEIMMFGDYLQTHSVSSYERVFKLNGRYKLNSKFNYNEHLEAKDKVVVLGPFRSGHFYNFDVAASMFMYSTRCWSFDSGLVSKIIKIFDTMKADILYASITEKQADIEHLLYRHLNKKFVKNVQTMGVEGLWAPRGSLIDE